MKKILTQSLLFLLLAAITAAADDKSLGMKQFTSVDEIASSISAYFPKVQGVVKSVQGDQLTITLGTKDGVVSGVELSLWRDGKEIHHPVTGEVIGRTEDEVGSLEINTVGDTTSTGVLKKKLKEPMAGDKARITPKKIVMAIVPLRTDRPDIIEGIRERLKDSNRFELIGHDRINDFLSTHTQRDASLIKELGRTFKLDVVATIEVVPADTKYLVTTRLFYADDAQPLDTVVAMLDLRSKADALGEIRPFFAPPKEERVVTPELPVDARYFTVGDFEGDGKMEYAFLDRERLSIYRFDLKWREIWKEDVPKEYGMVSLEWSGQSTVADPSAGIQYINIDAADIDGDGKAEIFETAMLGGKVFSRVFKYDEGIYRHGADIPALLRVITLPGKGQILVGQDFDPNTFYSGALRQYTWSGNAYVPGPTVSVPPGVGLYGFALSGLGEQNTLCIAFDSDDKLVVYSKDVAVWKSEKKYTSVPSVVYLPATGLSAVLSGSSPEKNKRQRIPGRISVLDINGDGKDEVLLPMHEGGTILNPVMKGELAGLKWTGARLEEAWSVKALPGAVLDFQVIRTASGASQLLGLVKTAGGLFSKDRQQVMVFSFQ